MNEEVGDKTYYGSCLSYGHSCWGAHGKRSGGGVVVPSNPQQRPIESGNVGVMQQNRRMPPLDERWFLSRLVNRQPMLVPLAARLRVTQILDGDSPMINKFDKNVELKDLEKSDKKLIDDEPDKLLIAEQIDIADNEKEQAIKAELIKILRSME